MKAIKKRDGLQRFAVVLSAVLAAKNHISMQMRVTILSVLLVVVGLLGRSISACAQTQEIPHCTADEVVEKAKAAMGDTFRAMIAREEGGAQGRYVQSVNAMGPAVARVAFNGSGRPIAICKALFTVVVYRNGQSDSIVNIKPEAGFYYASYTNSGNVAVWIPGAQPEFPDGVIPGSSDCGGGNWCDPGLRCGRTKCLAPNEPND